MTETGTKLDVELRERGTPSEYPHLLRNANTRWWHPLAGAAVLVIGWAIPSGALSELLSAVGGADTTGGSSALDVAALGLTIALMIPGAVAAVVLVHRTRSSVLLSATRRPRADLFVLAVVVATPAFVPMMLAKTAGFGAGPESTGGAGWVGWPAFLPFLAAVVLVFPLQAAAEEIVFRGYFTPAIAIWTRRAWLAALASSLMFVAVHTTHDAWSFVDRLFFGLAMCWLTWRTGGLEAAIALHVTYNVLLGLAVGATGRMGSMLDASTVDPLGALTSMGGTALAVLAVAWWAHDRRVPVRTDGPREAVHQ